MHELSDNRDRFDRVVAALTNGTLQCLLGEIQKALAIDDSIPKGQPKKYGVREYGDFRAQVDAIESELARRGVTFQRAAW